MAEDTDTGPGWALSDTCGRANQGGGTKGPVALQAQVGVRAQGNRALETVLGVWVCGTGGVGQWNSGHDRCSQHVGGVHAAGRGKGQGP